MSVHFFSIFPMPPNAAGRHPSNRRKGGQIMSDKQKPNAEGNAANDPEADTRPLDVDALGMVNGGDNPFADIPRVPTQNIDPEIREDA